MNLRPLVVSDVCFPRVNGVSTSIRSFREDLAALGVASSLVAPVYGPQDASESGLQRVPSRPVPRDPEDRLMNWRALRAALRDSRHAECTLVHIQTPFLAHYAGLRHARERGLPVVATCHTYFEDYLQHYVPLLPHRASAWLARRAMTHQLNAVDCVISPSEQVRSRLLEYGVTRPVEVIPTGMTADRFHPGDAARFRARLAVPAERRMLLILGRVAFEKNIAFLLRMFAIVRDRDPATLLVIAGEGPAQPALQREAARLGVADAVRFIGNLDRERDLNDCYAAADAFVFASRTETQGLVLLEAMAQGRPVVSTACLGTRSVLAGESGAFVVDENEQQFAAAVLAVLRDPAGAAERAAKGLAWARRWSSRAMAQRLAQLYTEVQTNVGAAAPLAARFR
ncbi:MAG: glycosyltransferase [Steroidobacteraceae bacterium]